MKLKYLISVLLLSSIAMTSNAVEWAVGGNVAQSEFDLEDSDGGNPFDSAIGAEIYGAAKLDTNVWLNFGYKNSGKMDTKDLDNDDDYSEATVQQFRLFMEGRRPFNELLGIFVAVGFSRYKTEVEQIPENTSQTRKGFTYGGSLGMDFNVNEVFGFRVGWEAVQDVVDSDDDTVGLEGFFVGIQVDL